LPLNRATLFLKIEVELDEDEKPEDMGEEICRQILRMYGVRAVELSSAMHLSD
jgi:hypothetical protein